VAPTVFSTDVAEDQRALYKSRKGGNAFQTIRRMQGLLSCPMCGSSSTGGLDHYLPRHHYPEFSIMLANLVPACMHCNSSSKGNKVKGVSPERFIHPYFDTVANDPIWYVEIDLHQGVPTFTAKALSTLAQNVKPIVQFHLDNVLGYQFASWTETFWSSTAQVIRDSIGGSGAVTAKQVTIELTRLLRQAIATHGLNSWMAAFCRGAIASNAVVIQLVSAVSALAEVPLASVV
jgi:hypothetical protein